MIQICAIYLLNMMIFHSYVETTQGYPGLWSIWIFGFRWVDAFPKKTLQDGAPVRER